MEISIVNTHIQVHNLKSIDIQQAFESIRTGGKIKDKILEIRKAVQDGESESYVKELKAKLPAFLFNGTFNYRNINGLRDGSGFMILDFDDITSDFEKVLRESKFVYSYFISPSGTGFKALIKIPVVKSDFEYKSYFYAVQQAFTNVDPSGKDVARLCYFSYDPNIYINDNAETWTEKVSTTLPKNISSRPDGRLVTTNWKHLTLAMSMISNSMVGNRHATMLKAGRLIGGYIAGHEIDESATMNVLQTHIQNHSPDDWKDHIKAFLDGVAHGKKEPLTSGEVHKISLEVKIGKIHFTIDDVIDKMDYLYEHGYDTGYYLGWKGVDELYSVHLGSTTYIYSAPHSGKTQFWMEGLVNLSVFYGMHHAIFTPETGDAAAAFIELAQIYCKKDFIGAYKMPPAEKEIAYAFIREHFIILDGDSFDKDLSVEDVCDYVTLLERDYNQKIHTLTIDPFNELKHDYGEARDLYLENMLKYIRRSAKNNDRHICVITHVRDQFPVHVKDKGYTYFPIPTARDVAGGQTWYRKGMMMIAIWRPIVMTKHDSIEIVEVENRVMKSNQTIVQIQKAKPKGRGFIGEVNLYYHWQEHSFVDENGQHASKKESRGNGQYKDLTVDELVEPAPF